MAVSPDPEVAAGQDLAIALLTNDAAIGDAIHKSDSGSESEFFSQDEAILDEISAASDQAKVTAIMVLELIARSLAMELSDLTGRREIDIVSGVARRVRGNG